MFWMEKNKSDEYDDDDDDDDDECDGILDGTSAQFVWLTAIRDGSVNEHTFLIK